MHMRDNRVKYSYHLQQSVKMKLKLAPTLTLCVERSLCETILVIFVIFYMIMLLRCSVGSSFYRGTEAPKTKTKKVDEEGKEEIEDSVVAIVILRKSK